MSLSVKYQRLEALAILVAAVIFYFWLHYEWWWFVIFLFAFDISMVGYLIDKRTGAHVYNAIHSLVLPSASLAVGAITHDRVAIGLGLIWLSHVALDRTLGYGLKEPDSFKHTHLGTIGRK